MQYPIYDDAENIVGYYSGRLYTCATEGCGNEGIPLEMPDNGNVKICGPCGQKITPGAAVPD